MAREPIILLPFRLAYLTFPLMVYTINAQLSAEISRLIATKRLLSEMQQFLDVMKLRFDNAAFLKRAIDEFARIFIHELTQDSDSSRPQDILSCNLKIYILLPAFVDFILSKGRLPRDDELSRSAKELIDPLRNCSESSATRLMGRHSFPPARDTPPCPVPVDQRSINIEQSQDQGYFALTANNLVDDPFIAAGLEEILSIPAVGEGEISWI